MVDLIFLLGREKRDPIVLNIFKQFPGLKSFDQTLDGITENYIQSPEDGLEIHLTEEGKIDYLFVFIAPNQKYSAYKKTLGYLINAQATPPDIVGQYGEPSFVYEGNGENSLGSSPAIRYDYTDYSIHFEFKPDTLTLSLVTFMHPSALPE